MANRKTTGSIHSQSQQHANKAGQTLDDFERECKPNYLELHDSIERLRRTERIAQALIDDLCGSLRGEKVENEEVEVSPCFQTILEFSHVQINEISQSIEEKLHKLRGLLLGGEYRGDIDDNL